MEIKVSVIVTVHNSELYLRECLKSVCCQTLNEIEIICVDGGSQDKTPQILREFQQQDERIEIIYDKNTSYGHKINVGISVAKGEYIAILESDDIMQFNMLEVLYSTAKKQNVDYVDCDYYQFYTVDNLEYKEEISKYPYEEIYGQVFCGDMVKEKILTPGIMAIWTGIYKKDFLQKKDIRLNESPGASFQDVGFRFLTAVLADSSYHVKMSLHKYRIDNINSSVKDNSKITIIQKEYEYLKKELIRRNINDKYIWEFYYLWKYNGFLWNVCRLEGESQELFLNIFAKEFKSDIENQNINEGLFHRYKIEIFELLKDRDKFYNQIIELQQSQRRYIEKKNNILSKTGRKPVVIFGAGIRGKQVMSLLQHQVICGVCDNDIEKQGEWYGEFEIISCLEAVKRYKTAYFTVVSKNYSEEMKQQLLSLGVCESKILIY